MPFWSHIARRLLTEIAFLWRLGTLVRWCLLAATFVGTLLATAALLVLLATAAGCCQFSRVRILQRSRIDDARRAILCLLGNISLLLISLFSLLLGRLWLVHNGHASHSSRLTPKVESDADGGDDNYEHYQDNQYVWKGFGFGCRLGHKEDVVKKLYVHSSVLTSNNIVVGIVGAAILAVVGRSGCSHSHCLLQSAPS